MTNWSVRDGTIYWRDREWSTPSRLLGKDDPSEADLLEYCERLAARYPGETPGILLGDFTEKPDPTRGGPWRWTLPDGQSEVIQTSRLEDAKKVLRHQLQRQRLPNGIEWELALDKR